MPKPLSKLLDHELAARIRQTRQEVGYWYGVLDDITAFGDQTKIADATRKHKNAFHKLRRLQKEQDRRLKEKKAAYLKRTQS